MPLYRFTRNLSERVTQIMQFVLFITRRRRKVPGDKAEHQKAENSSLHPLSDFLILCFYSFLIPAGYHIKDTPVAMFNIFPSPV